MRKKVISSIFIFLLVLCSLHISSFAGVDQVKLFLSTDFTSTSFGSQATNYAADTFEKLGYDIQLPSIPLRYFVTNSKSVVMDYIRGTGDNYAFFVFAHGNAGRFTMNVNDINQYIFSDEITGAWHLVFINSCNSMANTSLAEAFRTVGYSNRASLGWFDIVTDGGSAEWWGYFKNYAGTMSLRDACLEAASHCQHSTPIRILGDTSWYGFAWD